MASNYVLNRTVGDMLRSNQTISALGRLARRWAALARLGNMTRYMIASIFVLMKLTGCAVTAAHDASTMEPPKVAPSEACAERIVTHPRPVLDATMLRGFSKGWVLVKYELMPDGTPKNVRVDSEYPSDRLGTAVAQSVLASTFTKSTEHRHCSLLYKFQRQ